MRGSIGYNEDMKYSDLCQLVYDTHAKITTSLNIQNTYRYCYDNHAIPYYGSMKISKIKRINIQKFIN